MATSPSPEPPSSVAPLASEPLAGVGEVAGKVVFVCFSAEINAHTTESLIAVVVNCANHGAAEVRLLMSTPGGSVMSGINLYNVLRGLPFRLVTHNVGNVDSIGNAIFLAGDHRLVAPHSTFMFHGVGFETPASTHFDEKLLRERLDSILADQNRIAGIIEERTNLTARQVAPLFREAKTKDATYAVSTGIVHQIQNVDIPAGSPVIALVFKR
jgi:ATP-dependent protease ClpP protease subunit